MTNSTAPTIHRSFKAQASHSDETGVKKDDVFKIPPHLLLEEPDFNERDYDDPRVVAKIEEFAQAYARGQFVPHLVVRIDAGTGKFYIVEGHQRTRGAMLAISRGVYIPHLVCIPFRGNDMDRVHCQMDSQDGLKLTPVGIARNYLKLLRMGASEEEIAKRRNKELSHVQAMLVLAEAPVEIQRMVNIDQVSATTAIEVLRERGDGALEFLRKTLQEEQAKGKTKIRPAAVREWTPPRKSAIAIYASVGSLVGSLKEEGFEGDPETLQGKTVSVDALALFQLMQVFQQAEAQKGKRAKGSNSGEESAEEGAATDAATCSTSDSPDESKPQSPPSSWLSGLVSNT